MNSLSITAFAVVLAVAQAGVIGLHSLAGSGLEGQVGLIGSGLEGQVGLIGSGLEGQVGLVGSGIEGQVGLIGSGLEGQYVPSGLERLSDDGSYRGEHHIEGVGISAVGLPGVLGHGAAIVARAGSGLEGQYAPSGNELLHDDGSYRVEHHLAGHNLILH